MTEPRHVCAICGLVLNKITGGGGSRWDHSRPQDHPALPIEVTAYPAAQVVNRCDFCYGEDVRWMIPAKTFTTPVRGSVSVEHWAACEECVKCVNRDDWTGLHRRALAEYERRNGVALGVVEGAMVLRLYRKLRRNINGAPVPIEEFSD